MSSVECVGQEKEFVMRLTNRERGEHCSSTSPSYSFFFLHPRFPLDVRREKRKIPPSSLSSTRRMSARKMNERVRSRREEKKEPMVVVVVKGEQ